MASSSPLSNFLSGQHDLFKLNSAQFDFNIQFEQLFFSILPSAVFVLTSGCRTIFQARREPIVGARGFQAVKAVAITIYVAFELALLVLAVDGAFSVSSLFLAACALKLVAALCMVPLSLLDHSRSPRPSALLSVYLLLTLLLDGAQARTLFLSSHSHPEFVYSCVFSAASGLKLILLLLEAKQKSIWVNWVHKEHSPEETSGVFALGVFFWLNSLFRTGYKKIITLDDLFPLDTSMDSKRLHGRFCRYMDPTKLKGDKYGLAKVLIRTLQVQLLLPVVPRLALIAFTIAQPLFLEQLVNYLAESDLDRNKGYGFIGAAFFIYLGIAISTAFYWYLHNRLRVMIRSLLVTEISIKATQFRIGVGDETAALTLMSTDIERIRLGFRSVHETWACLLQAGLAAWMLYIRLGVVFVAPVGIVVLCFTTLGFLMNFTGDSQRAWMAGVQKRVGLTATVISSMKNLKISGLTAPVGDYVQQLRIAELAAGVRWRKIFIAAALLGFIPQLIAPPVTFAAAEKNFDASTVFTSLGFITLLTFPLSQVFEGVPQIIAGLTCLRRIQAFLEGEDRQDFREMATATKSIEEKPAQMALDFTSDVKITIENGGFGWKSEKFPLRNVNAKIYTNSLNLVVGPIGSGKSTLCKALLGEIPFSEGRIVCSGPLSHVGFCDQTPFLSNGSLKDNIVGYSTFDAARYSEVVHACALDTDFATLPEGGETNIGSDGITLSGGQRQRVSLARALYLESDMLILDDIFSGLDAGTEEKVFRRVFGPAGLIRRRRTTVVFCTHSLRCLPFADHILVVDEGTVVQQGSFSDLMKKEGYVQALGLQQPALQSAENDEDSNVISIMKKEAEERKPSPVATTTSIASTTPISKIDQARQTGDKSVYSHYARMAGWFTTGVALFLAALWGFFTNFPTIWLTYWINDVDSVHPSRSYGFYAGIYALLQICALLSLLLLAITLWIFALQRVGSNLHQNALRTLLQAPLRFFAQTDTGVVTNLFSQDLNLIDTELPNALLDTLFSIFQALGQAAVMLTSSVYLAIAYPFLAALLYVVGRFYLRTSRQLRLLDLEAKSPMYTHFLDTIKGITTLRAFGSVPSSLEKNAQLLSTSQRPAYLLLMIQEWLKLVLNLVVMALAVVLVALSTQLHSSSAFAGASLYSLITFGQNLTGIILYFTRLETSLGAIARLKSFGDTVVSEEKEEEDVVPEEGWPWKGEVELNGVSARYKSEDEEEDSSLALRNVSLSISSGSKYAICGRTGSGKSSLIALLLKLLDPLSSTPSITIDDLPLSKISRPALRQRIIAIPQDAVFLPDGASFRSNLDPSLRSPLADCEAVLLSIGLWHFVSERGGLEAGMSPGTMSAGQKQLFSVGRALLRRRQKGGDGKKGILLLDEVSSSVDRRTEKIIQGLIKEEFEEYTVVAVSHRLEMVMDFDRVVVMEKGEVVEVGEPMVLAGREGTRFGELLKAAGGSHGGKEDK